ncbi:MAG: hypothetical protein HYV75_01800, partial [Opitutae bacterium]|nr:hypothetical protein [Opitutae bacterium]
MSTRRTLLTALIATAISVPALAQQPTTPPADSTAAPEAAPAAAAPAVSVEGAAPVAAPVTRDKDTLSVDFPDEDIKTILRNVADLFELNLVVPDTLTGKTSIKLRDVTWRQIFQVVLSPVGYTYIEEGNIIKIVSNELLQQEPGTTEVFIINNAKAEELKPTIAGLIDVAGGGKIEVNPRANALIITERPSRMSRIRSIIEQLDKATDQVMIESKFVEVTDRDVRNIGVNWASLERMSFGVGSIKQTFTRNRGQDFVNGTDSSAGSTSDTTNGTNRTNNTTTTSGNTSSTTTTFNPGSTTSLTTTTTPISPTVQSTSVVTTDTIDPTNNGTVTTTTTTVTPATGNTASTVISPSTT